MTKQVKELVPQEPGHLKFYSCGPTVYNFAHIGNFRTFLTGDLVVRTAESLGWKVDYVSNITDVGHLTEDDVEEDRMAKGLRSKEGQQFTNVWDLADFYADAFKADWLRINLRKPLVWPKATQHMREQIVGIEELIKKGNAYETPTGVYYDVSSFKEYGKLSGNDLESLQEGVREVVLDDNKRRQADFALWKKDDKHLMQWFSPWGWGFPGWHMECSVMAMQYLGDTLDLHAGGEDLIFPHHECEIAQSEALTGKPFCNHWIHTRFLLVDGERMAKSKGNFYTARDITEGKGADPLALRYALISQNYGTPHNFTMDLLRDASQKIERYKLCDETVAKAAVLARDGDDTVGVELEELWLEALSAMCDNLNTSVALGKALEGTRVILREGDKLTASGAASAKTYLDRINGLLGIVRHDELPPECFKPVETGPNPESIDAMVAERVEAKKVKDFARADAIRAQLDALGIEVRDSPEGTTWKRKAPVFE